MLQTKCKTTGTVTHGKRLRSGNGTVTHGRRLKNGNDRSIGTDATGLHRNCYKDFRVYDI